VSSGQKDWGVSKLITIVITPLITLPVITRG
jgi:hypothetical protein